MPNYTNFLGLLQKDPVADAKDTFNIQTMLNDNWEKIDASCMGAARIKVGSYTGTGLYGEANPNQIQADDIVPHLVIVYQLDALDPTADHIPFMIAARGMNVAYTCTELGTPGRAEYSNSYRSILSWDDHSLKWWSFEGSYYKESATAQLNVHGVRYGYIILGLGVPV